MKSKDDKQWTVRAPEWAVDKAAIAEKINSKQPDLTPSQRSFAMDKAVDKARIVGVFDNEADAVSAMMEHEAETLIDHGYSEAAVSAIYRGRQLTNRGFDVMAEDVRTIIAKAAENGDANPFAQDGKLDEAGRYGVYAAGKKGRLHSIKPF